MVRDHSTRSEGLQGVERWIAAGLALLLVGSGVAYHLLAAPRAASHREFLDDYVAALREGSPATPGPSEDASLAALAQSKRFEVRSSPSGHGTDGGSTCYEITAYPSKGSPTELVLGVSDENGPLRIAGWGLSPPCHCPRSGGGSLRCR